MRFLNLALILAVSITAITGCGGSKDAPASAPVTQAAAACPSGQVQSAQYGCLNQSTCPTGQGVYNNTCVSLAVGTAGTQTTCAAGQIQSYVYGCLTQAPCPEGMGIYNNKCIAVDYGFSARYCAPGNTITQVGCLSQGSCEAGQVSYQNRCFDLMPMRAYNYSNYGRGGLSFEFNFR